MCAIRAVVVLKLILCVGLVVRTRLLTLTNDFLTLCAVVNCRSVRDQVAAPTVRRAADAHILEIASRELDAAPTLTEPSMFLLSANLVAQPKGDFTRNGVTQACPQPQTRNKRR
jgi:hypothetical protein